MQSLNIGYPIQASQKCNLIPVSMEFPSDLETPVSIYMRFMDRPCSFLLESAESVGVWGRYSFICTNPMLTIKNINNKNYIKYRTGEQKIIDGNPADCLRNILSRFNCSSQAPISNLPPFTGGAVGFFGYDVIRHFEKLENMPVDDIQLPDAHFAVFDEVIVFDHFRHKIIIIVNAVDNGFFERDYARALARAKQIYEEINTLRWKTVNNVHSGMKLKECISKDCEKQTDNVFETNMSKEDFISKVSRAKEYIMNGDIFQVVLSQRFKKTFSREELNCFDVYRALRMFNPSPYMFFLNYTDYCISGASPEMLAKITGDKLETCPIAGTRKRGDTDEEDKSIEYGLIADEKENAEHMMLVDLSRNDAGRVCRFGTVKVDELKKIHKFSHVMHMVSRVTGTLREDKDVFDALTALIPAGTLSGAPKIRAMEIIDELEPTKRGIYGGTTGYFSFNGNADTCITIRTLVMKKTQKTIDAYIQTGAGIVMDSEPEKEYEETLNKAKAMMKALEMAGEMF